MSDQKHNNSENEVKVRYKDIKEKWMGVSRKDGGNVLYAKSVTSGGKRYYIKGNKVQLKPSNHEINVAQLICELTGKTIMVLPKVNIPEGILTPDYLINGKQYELKTVYKNGKNTIYNKFEKRQSNNFILYVDDNSGQTEESLKEQIKKVFCSERRRHVNRIVVIMNKKIIAVYKKSK